MGTASALPLVGRDEVLAGLTAALDQARAGRGGLVLVTGEAGIGKTRLAAEAVKQAQGFTTVWSWCALDPATGPFRPWVQVVRELAAADAHVARQAVASPHLASLLSRASVASEAPPDAELVRWQFFDAVADMLRSAAARTPLLVILDDVHDAQESSLWLLAHLVPTLRSCAVVVLATAREGEHAWHGHVEVQAALSRQANSIRLGPLNDAHIGELFAHLTREPQSEDIAPRVLARTGGNPLLVSELVRVLTERHDTRGSAIGVAVPESVRAITAERIARFGATCQRLLLAAAVLGSRFRLDVLAAVADIDLGAVRDVLREAELGGMVDMTEPGAGGFVHELIRDAVYERMAPAERCQWHAAAGSVLANLSERGRDVEPAEVAHHLLNAGPQAAGMAAQFAQLAGDVSARLLAYEDAATWYQRAIEALDLAEVDPTRRALLLLALGEARLGCGDRERARAGFLKAATLGREAGQPKLLARAALGIGSGQAGFEVGLLDREQLDLLEEARRVLPEDEQALRALVTARLSVASTMIEPDERRLSLAEEALVLARQAEDDAAQAYALAAVCDALAGPEHNRARLAYAAEIVEHATRLRSPPLELLGRRLGVVALLETGNRRAAEAEMTAYRVRAEAFGHPLYTWYIPLWRAMWALAEGRLADSRKFNARAEVEGNTAGSHNAFLLVVTQRWCLLAELEDRDGINALFRGIDFEQVGGLWARISSALVMAQLGNRDEALRRLDAVAAQLASLPRDSEWLPCIAQVAETIGLIGPHVAARWTYDALRPFAELFVIEGIGAAVRGPVHRHLGILAAALGQDELARDHFGSALEAARGLGAPGLVERIQAELSLLTTSESRASAVDNVFHHDGEYWKVAFGGRDVQLRDSKGLRDLALLLAQPGVHVAALDLASPSTGLQSRPGSSDAGELLDAAARDAYRRRLVELEEEASDADAAGDMGRSAHISAEREALVEQLTAAYGLGGRARRAGSVTERARTAVTARIREALRRIQTLHPELGRHLVRSVRTGTFCVYEPEVPTRWQT